MPDEQIGVTGQAGPGIEGQIPTSGESGGMIGVDNDYRRKRIAAIRGGGRNKLCLKETCTHDPGR